MESGETAIGTKDGGFIILASELFKYDIRSDPEGWDTNGTLIKLSRHGFKQWAFDFKGKGYAETSFKYVFESEDGGYFAAANYISHEENGYGSGFVLFKLNKKGNCIGPGCHEL